LSPLGAGTSLFATEFDAYLTTCEWPMTANLREQGRKETLPRGLRTFQKEEKTIDYDR